MSGPMYCVNHPGAETYLRCNKCGQPICAKCAVQTPVGYRCKNCINTQQQVFYTGFRPIYYLVAAVVALPLSFVAGIVIPMLSWFAIFLGPVAGGGIAELVRLAIRRRRGKYVWLIVCGSIIVGALPALLLPLLALVGLTLLSGNADGVFGSLLGGALGMIWPAVYVVTAVGAAYWRLRPGGRV
jgi:hypothetical protein